MGLFRLSQGNIAADVFSDEGIEELPEYKPNAFVKTPVTMKTRGAFDLLGSPHYNQVIPHRTQQVQALQHAMQYINKTGIQEVRFKVRWQHYAVGYFYANADNEWAQEETPKRGEVVETTGVF